MGDVKRNETPVLAERIIDRYGDSPGVIPETATVKRARATFGYVSNRLPLLRDVLMRWTSDDVHILQGAGSMPFVPLPGRTQRQGTGRHPIGASLVQQRTVGSASSHTCFGGPVLGHAIQLSRAEKTPIPEGTATGRPDAAGPMRDTDRASTTTTPPELDGQPSTDTFGDTTADTATIAAPSPTASTRPEIGGTPLGERLMKQHLGGPVTRAASYSAMANRPESITSIPMTDQAQHSTIIASPRDAVSVPAGIEISALSDGSPPLASATNQSVQTSSPPSNIVQRSEDAADSANPIPPVLSSESTAESISTEKASLPVVQGKSTGSTGKTDTDYGKYGKETTFTTSSARVSADTPNGRIDTSTRQTSPPTNGIQKKSSPRAQHAQEMLCPSTEARDTKVVNSTSVNPTSMAEQGRVQRRSTVLPLGRPIITRRVEENPISKEARDSKQPVRELRDNIHSQPSEAGTTTTIETNNVVVSRQVTTGHKRAAENESVHSSLSYPTEQSVGLSTPMSPIETRRNASPPASDSMRPMRASSSAATTPTPGKPHPSDALWSGSSKEATSSVSKSRSTIPPAVTKALPLVQTASQSITGSTTTLNENRQPTSAGRRLQAGAFDQGEPTVRTISTPTVSMLSTSSDIAHRKEGFTMGNETPLKIAAITPSVSYSSPGTPERGGGPLPRSVSDIFPIQRRMFEDASEASPAAVPSATDRNAASLPSSEERTLPFSTPVSKTPPQMQMRFQGLPSSAPDTPVVPMQLPLVTPSALSSRGFGAGNEDAAQFTTQAGAGLPGGAVVQRSTDGSPPPSNDGKSSMTTSSDFSSSIESSSALANISPDELERLADEIYAIIERRLAMEREALGL